MYCTSTNGYLPSTLKLGLGKYICRGNFTKAMYCAHELNLFRSSTDPKARDVHTDFLHSLMTIFLKRVGPCGLGMLPLMHKYFSILLSKMGGKTGERALVECVAYLVFSEKGEDNNFYKFFYSTIYSTNEYDNLLTNKLPTVNRNLTLSKEDFFELLTKKDGLAVRFGWQVSQKGTYIFDCIKEYTQDHLSGKKKKFYLVCVDIMSRWYEELRDENCWQTLVLGLVLDVDITNKTCIPKFFPTEQYNLDGGTIEIDEYITPLRNGYAYFAETSCVLENEWEGTNVHLKRLYKRYIDRLCGSASQKETTPLVKESEAFHHISWIDSKSYYAMEKSTKKIVIVSGPYDTSTQVIDSEPLRKVFNKVKVASSTVLYLLSNKYGEGGYFVVSENVHGFKTKREALRRKIPTKVTRQTILFGLFRYIFGLSQLPEDFYTVDSRGIVKVILVKGYMGKEFRINESVIDEQSFLRFVNSKRKCGYWYSSFQRNKDALNDTLGEFVYNRALFVLGRLVDSPQKLLNCMPTRKNLE